MVEKLPQETRNLITVIMYSILFCNDMALSFLFDTLNEIEKSPFCKHKIKWYVSRIRFLMRDYNQKLQKRTKMIGFIADINDLFYEKIEQDVWKLENSTLNYLTRCHISNPRLMSKIVVCDMLCQTACVNVDVNCNDSEVKHLIRGFKFFKLAEIRDVYKKMSHLVDDENAKLNDAICDVNKCVEINNGYNIIIKKIQDSKLIWDVIKQSDNLNKKESI